LVLLLPPLRAPSRGPRSALSLHDALPIYPARYGEILRRLDEKAGFDQGFREALALEAFRHTAAYDAAIEAYFARRREGASEPGADRKSTRLNSSHVKISYAVFCLKKESHH